MMTVLLPTPVSASLPLTQSCIGVHFKQVGSTFTNILEMHSCCWMSSVIRSAEKERSSQTESSTTRPICVAPSSTGSISEVALCPWLTPSVYQPSSLPIVQQIFRESCAEASDQQCRRERDYSAQETCRVLSTGRGGGEASPPQMSIFPPKHFHKIWQNTTDTLAINFLSAINKVQSSKLCHRLSNNRSC